MDKNEKKGIFTIGSVDTFVEQRNQGLEELYENLQAFNSAIETEFDSYFTEIIENGFGENEGLHQLSGIDRQYYDIYVEYLSQFENMIAQRVAYDGVDIHHFIDKAKALRVFEPFRTNANGRMVQQFCIMTQVTRFVNHLYLALVDRKLPVFGYMQDGARLLGYTDKRLFGKMYGAMLMKNRLNIPTAIIRGFFGGNSVVPCSLLQSKGAGDGAAAADYPYKFASVHQKVVQIKPVAVKGKLQYVYDPADCSIKLGLGEQAALFTIPNAQQKGVVLSFAGTEFKLTKRGVHNMVTDAAQILFGPETTYLAAVGLLKDVANCFATDDIYVVGHSLGGGLMQYAVTGVGGDNIHGIGYNSAGLSNYSKKTLTGERIRHAEKRICHICADTDFISPIGSQIGRVLHINTGKRWSHSLNHLNRRLNGELIGCSM